MSTNAPVENTNVDNESTATFKYRDFRYLVLWLVLVEVFGVTMSVIWVRQGGILGGLTFFILFCSFFGIAGTITILGKSDIHIDDHNISRSIFGKEWQKISWDDVQKIWVFTLSEYGKNKPVRSIVIYPLEHGSRFSLMLSARMAFQDKAENMDQLIKIINSNISKHNIKVEMTTTGNSKTIISQI